MKIRWGILGAANIARKNYKAIWNSGNGIVTAVASRDLRRAQEFIHDCQLQGPMADVPLAFADYDQVLRRSDVDAVYIPLPTGLRKDLVLRAARAGKHVLCEKPCASSTRDLEEMIAVCREHQVQFMDGVMFMHSRRLPRLKEAAANEIGQLRRITSAFSFRGSDEFFTSNIRVSKEMEPFGCLGDLGWYCIRLALCLTDEIPRSVTGRSLVSSKAGVPLEFSGELFFEREITSSFFCSFFADTEQWARITGTKGLVHLNDFVLPFFGSEVNFSISNPLFDVRGCDFRMEPRTHRVATSEYSNSDPTSQETNLFRNFAQLVLSGKLDDSWPEIALRTQRVMAACYESAQNGGSEVAL
jgi:predicted dehydrogenase